MQNHFTRVVGTRVERVALVLQPLMRGIELWVISLSAHRYHISSLTYHTDAYVLGSSGGTYLGTLYLCFLLPFTFNPPSPGNNCAENGSCTTKWPRQ